MVLMQPVEILGSPAPGQVVPGRPDGLPMTRSLSVARCLDDGASRFDAAGARLRLSDHRRFVNDSLLHCFAAVHQIMNSAPLLGAVPEWSRGADGSRILHGAMVDSEAVMSDDGGA
jgi:hypothetical protein